MHGLRTALASWALVPVTDIALLVLSEIITNAGRHARASPGWAFVEDASDSPAIHETECTTCGEGPEPTASEGVAVRHLWCAEHVVRTGHTGFLALLRAVVVHEVRR
ncbi:DUF7848 domain-containing protein [Streptomyces sp. NPDC002932]|uniref:DUF7848 domain-containing protein n=1 Tax=Streptomyces sp. NPDC002932 TaxID=3364672 RepID=UPI0036C69A29